MATVYIDKRSRQGGGNSYVVTFRCPLTGKNKYYKTYRKRIDASTAKNKLVAMLDSGKMPEQKKKYRPLKFEDVVESLKASWQDKMKFKQLAPKTVEGYVTWATVLCREFGDQLLTEITQDDILAYRNSRAIDLSNVTANRELEVLHQIMRHGIHLNALVEDPTKGIAKLSEKEHERSTFLLPEQLTRLLKESEKIKRPAYLSLLILLGAEHGASKQECLDLRWEDIDLEYKGTGLIRLFRTKNGRKRTEYLMPRTREALRGWKEHLEWTRHRKRIEANDTFVICRLDGSPLKRFDKAFRGATKRAGLAELHFHDLRHTFCSNILLVGGDLKDAKDMIGHSDISMTDRYAHLTAEHKLVVQKKLAEHYTEGCYIFATQSKIA